MTETTMPTVVEQRTAEYESMGVPSSQAQAAAARDLGYTNAEVAEMLGVSESAASSYYTKFNDRIPKAIRLFISQAGGPARVLALSEWRGYGRTQYKAITMPFTDIGAEVDGDAAVEHDQYVCLIEIEAGGPSGEPDGTINASSTGYASLRGLARAEYEAGQVTDLLQAEQWYDLLGEAGGESFKQKLTPPGDTLPSEHPDSDDHFQYQMQSIERDGRR